MYKLKVNAFHGKTVENFTNGLKLDFPSNDEPGKKVERQSNIDFDDVKFYKDFSFNDFLFKNIEVIFDKPIYQNRFTCISSILLCK